MYVQYGRKSRKLKMTTSPFFFYSGSGLRLVDDPDNLSPQSRDVFEPDASNPLSIDSVFTVGLQSRKQEMNKFFTVVKVYQL